MECSSVLFSLLIGTSLLISQFSTTSSVELQQNYQNQMCASRNISQLPQMNFTLPHFHEYDSDEHWNIGSPKYRFYHNPNALLIYLVIDSSQPTSIRNAGQKGLICLKSGLKKLFSRLHANCSHVYVGLATFQNLDSGRGTYLKKAIYPRPYSDIASKIDDAINQFTFSDVVSTRDVSAAIRDAILELQRFHMNHERKVLYLISSTKSSTEDDLTETDAVEIFLRNKIELIAAESGPDGANSEALYRLSILTEGSHVFIENWSDEFFELSSNAIIDRCRNRERVHERRMIISKTAIITKNTPWSGHFSIDEMAVWNTAIVLRTPVDGLFSVTLKNPRGEIITLKNEPERTNWNNADSTIGITWFRLRHLVVHHVNQVVGQWSYTIFYNASSCFCPDYPVIHLQISSSCFSTGIALPQLRLWVSYPAGPEFAGMPQPVIIHARFFMEYSFHVFKEGPLCGLIVTANIAFGSEEETIPLFDSTESEISRDGTYTAMLYLAKDGDYSISIHALDQKSSIKRSPLLKNIVGQDDFCSQSSIPTVVLENFEMTVNEAGLLKISGSHTILSAHDFQVLSYLVDSGKIYANLSWTVPFYVKSQKVKFSEALSLITDNYYNEREVEIEEGSYEEFTQGKRMVVYATVPYFREVCLAVEFSGLDNRKTRSNVDCIFPTREPGTFPASSSNNFTTSPPTQVLRSTPSSVTNPSTTTTEARTSMTFTVKPSVMDTSHTTNTGRPNTTTDSTTTLLKFPGLTTPATSRNNLSVVSTTEITKSTSVSMDSITNSTTITAEANRTTSSATTVPLFTETINYTNASAKTSTAILESTTMVKPLEVDMTSGRPSTITGETNTTLPTSPSLTTTATTSTTLSGAPTTNPTTTITTEATKTPTSATTVSPFAATTTNYADATTKTSTAILESITAMDTTTTSRPTSSTTAVLTTTSPTSLDLTTPTDRDLPTGFIISCVVILGLIVISVVICGVIFYKKKRSQNYAVFDDSMLSPNTGEFKLCELRNFHARLVDAETLTGM